MEGRMRVRVENNTSNNVEYEQTGSGTDPREDGDEPIKGELKPGEKSPEFKPSGQPPFRLTFSSPPKSQKPERAASVGEIVEDRATVVLTAFPVVVE